MDEQADRVAGACPGSELGSIVEIVDPFNQAAYGEKREGKQECDEQPDGVALERLEVPDGRLFRLVTRTCVCFHAIVCRKLLCRPLYLAFVSCAMIYIIFQGFLCG